MKKFIILLLMVFIGLPIFSNDIYLDINSKIKNEESIESVIAAYEEAKDDLPLLFRGRIESSIGGYLVKLGDKTKALDYLNLASATQAQISPSTLESEVLFAQIALNDYARTGSINKGLGASDMVHKLYVKNTDSPILIIAEATRLFTLPWIVGGSSKASEKLYLKLQPKVDTLSIDLQFEFYAGLAKVYKKHNKKALALECAQLAKEIYPNNSDVNTIISQCK